MDEQGQILDFSDLNLNYFAQAVCHSIPKNNKLVDCVDYMKK